jgi:hypothetical protein
MWRPTEASVARLKLPTTSAVENADCRSSQDKRAKAEHIAATGAHFTMFPTSSRPDSPPPGTRFAVQSSALPLCERTANSQTVYPGDAPRVQM